MRAASDVADRTTWMVPLGRNAAVIATVWTRYSSSTASRVT